MKIEEIREFNNSKRNQRRINRSRGFAFVTCPDFSHSNGAYDFLSLGSGMPLSMSLAQDQLTALGKPVRVFVSDHEAYRPEVRDHLGLDKQTMLSRIAQSKDLIAGTGDIETQLLSSRYGYDAVSELKDSVPEGSHMNTVLITWSGEGFSRQELVRRYKEKYAQAKAFLVMCYREELCAVFLYSPFFFKLVPSMRKEIPAAIYFLGVEDPH